MAVTSNEARTLPLQVAVTLRKAISFDTPGIGTDATVAVGVLPAGAIITKANVLVGTAFNAATTNLIHVGVTGNDDASVDQTEVTAGTPAWYPADDLAVGNGYKATADTIIYVTYDQSGTAATTGAADVVVQFVQDNDG